MQGERPSQSAAFTARLVANLRRAYHLPSRYARLRRAGLLTVDEVARRLTVSPATVKVWRRHGLLRVHRYDRAFDITSAEWAELTGDQQHWLTTLAHRLDFEFVNGSYDISWAKAATDPTHNYHQLFQSSRPQGERMIRYARSQVEKDQSSDKFDQFHQLLTDLAKAMKQPYRFNVYAANPAFRSVNFGIVVTYRQRWEPVSYQVGELVKSIPLAPKEIRRYSKRTVTRQSRAEKEVENSLESRRTESRDTWRAETAIVQKALSKTNSQLGAKGGVNLGIAEASASTAMSHNTAQESLEVKKEFREAVFTAAQEYKAERTLQVETSSSLESTTEESGEIVNPNDEIPVTYLFYQLQRRHRVSEEVRTVVPVVLVAQEFPTPNQIDEDWIVAHDWILRRVLLDDSFVPAMNYLATKVVGDEVALRELDKNVVQQRRLLDEVKEQVVSARAEVAGRYTALEWAIRRRAAAVEEDDSGGGLFDIQKDFLLGGGGASPEAARVREDAPGTPTSAPPRRRRSSRAAWSGKPPR